jgi:hypothetical protein
MRISENLILNSTNEEMVWVPQQSIPNFKTFIFSATRPRTADETLAKENVS